MKIGTVCDLGKLVFLYHVRPLLLTKYDDSVSHDRKRDSQPVAVNCAFCYRIVVQHLILYEYNCQKLLTAIQVKC